MKKLDNFLSALKTLNALSDVDFFYYSKGEELIYNNMVSGYINHFNKTFELSWNIQKQILEYEGVNEAKSGSPNQILRLSYTYGLISNKKLWVEISSDRNSSTHLYDKEAIYALQDKITKRFLPEFNSLRSTVINRVFDLYRNNELPKSEIDQKLIDLFNSENKSADILDTTRSNGIGRK